MALSQGGFPRSRHRNKDLSTMKEALVEKWGNEMQKRSQPVWCVLSRRLPLKITKAKTTEENSGIMIKPVLPNCPTRGTSSIMSHLSLVFGWKLLTGQGARRDRGVNFLARLVGFRDRQSIFSTMSLRPKGMWTAVMLSAGGPFLHPFLLAPHALRIFTCLLAFVSQGIYRMHTIC